MSSRISLQRHREQHAASGSKENGAQRQPEAEPGPVVSRPAPCDVIPVVRPKWNTNFGRTKGETK
jgi:hypothetical protein